jgi:hypothetical protein
MILLLAIPFVATFVLVSSALSARSARRVIEGGLLGGAMLVVECFLLGFFARVDMATGGGGDIETMFVLALIASPAVLIVYLIIASFPLKQRREQERDDDSQRS